MISTLYTVHSSFLFLSVCSSCPGAQVSGDISGRPESIAHWEVVTGFEDGSAESVSILDS